MYLYKNTYWQILLINPNLKLYSHILIMEYYPILKQS